MTEKFLGEEPELMPSAWVHPTALIIGRVRVGSDVSVWPGAVIRGDVDRIEIGRGTNVQDLAVIHPNHDRPVLIGEGVTIGHSAIVHGSIVGDHCLIGMGAIVMDCEIGEYSLIAAGALVTAGTRIPPGSMVMGAPAKVKRDLTEQEREALLRSEKDYLELAAAYKRGGR